VIAKKEALMKAIGYLSIFALTAACLEARANGAIENVLVTGTYSPTNALTSAVSVLDEQQIRALNKRTVAGLLKTLPGVLVEEQGGPGGLTAVSIRGGEANFTLVLLDGVALNDPTNFRGGGFDFADLSTALVPQYRPGGARRGGARRPVRHLRFRCPGGGYQYHYPAPTRGTCSAALC
jgi:outer membrane cobalamin receptor